MAIPCSRSATNVSMRPVAPNATDTSVPFPPITWMPSLAGRLNVPCRPGIFQGLPVTSAPGCVNEQARTTSFVSSTGVNE